VVLHIFFYLLHINQGSSTREASRGLHELNTWFPLVLISAASSSNSALKNFKPFHSPIVRRGIWELQTVPQCEWLPRSTALSGVSKGKTTIPLSTTPLSTQEDGKIVNIFALFEKCVSMAKDDSMAYFSKG
jgi:hypothetical protein